MQIDDPLYDPVPSVSQQPLIYAYLDQDRVEALHPLAIFLCSLTHLSLALTFTTILRD